MRKRTLGIFLGAALVLATGNASAVSYSFTNIADSSGPFSAGFNRFPTITMAAA